jgi:hypothetical protein
MPAPRIALRTARHNARILCCVALMLLAACQQRGPDAPFARYREQLSATLAVPASAPQPGAILTPPLADTLQFEFPDTGIDSLDFLLLSGCAVQANIGKRQIALGQYAKSSQRLVLELEYLHLAPACINRLRDSHDTALADVLEKAWRAKQAQLPALIFNATLGSDEYRAFWLAVPAAGDYPRSSPEVAASAMAAINDQIQRWLTGDYRVHNRDFELLLSEVAGGDGGARLQGWTQQIAWLAAADRLLDRAKASRCSSLSGRAPASSSLARASTYFIDTVLPLATQSQQRYKVVAAPALALERQLNAILPTHYRDWIVARNQRAATLADTPTHHLERLKQLLSTCTAL